MRRNIKTIMIITTLFSINSLHANNQLTDNTPRLTALTHATLMIEPGKKIINASLLIQNNKIIEIIENNKVPNDALIIDLHGYTVYPGFIDPFTDYAIKFESPKDEVKPPIYEITRIGGNAENGAIHSEQSWFNYVHPNKHDAEPWIKNGFTSVQSSNLDGIFRGRGVTLSLAEKKANEIIYRAQSGHFLAFDKGSSPQDYPSSLMGSIALIRQTFADTDWYNDNKNKSFSKFETQLIEFNSALAAMDNIDNERVIFDTKNLNNQLRAAHLLNDHQLKASLLGNGREYARLDELKTYGYGLILPLNFPAAPLVGDDDNEREISLAQMRHWERAPANLMAVEESQLPFALTQYGIKAEDFWPKLKQAIMYGLSEEAALTALTTEAAEIVGTSDFSGRLKPGFIADLVITKGNIFEDGVIHSIWLQGDEQQLINRNTYPLDSSYQIQIGQVSLDLSISNKKNGTDHLRCV